MAISVIPGNKTIEVPQSYLTLLTGLAVGATEVYELDLNELRLDLRAWEDDELGSPEPRTHDHITDVTITGVTYDRAVLFTPYWTVDFEDTGTPYIVSCTGGNSNILEVTDLSAANVSVEPNNSAGRTLSATSGLTPTESAQLASVPQIEADITAIEVDISTIVANYAFPKNTAFSDFDFTMNSINGDPLSGLSVTGERRIDSGSYAPLANAVSEVASTGTYTVDLAASDLNGDKITLRFRATGAIERVATIVTSGS